ncbi:hypothetical protein PMAYCL1PPCAC_10761, partial [Pristionchus mayeri]
LLALVLVVSEALLVRPHTRKPQSSTVAPIKFASAAECNKMCSGLQKPEARKLCSQVCAVEFKKEVKLTTTRRPF